MIYTDRKKKIKEKTSLNLLINSSLQKVTAIGILRKKANISRQRFIPTLCIIYWHYYRTTFYQMYIIYNGWNGKFTQSSQERQIPPSLGHWCSLGDRWTVCVPDLKLWEQNIISWNSCQESLGSVRSWETQPNYRRGVVTYYSLKLLRILVTRKDWRTGVGESDTTTKYNCSWMALYPSSRTEGSLRHVVRI